MDGANLGDIESYVEGLFIEEDSALRLALEDAEEAGLPEIHVSPMQGRLLHLIAAISGASRILEVGTLGGYSTIHFARALPEDGRLITLELSGEHADIARRNFERAGLSEKIEVRVGDAKEAMRAMISSGESAFDIIFIDAEKEGYIEYLELSLALSRIGTVIIADNTIRGGSVIRGDTPDGRAMHDFNRHFAAHERLDGTIVPLIRQYVDGIAIGRVLH